MSSGALYQPAARCPGRTARCRYLRRSTIDRQSLAPGVEPFRASAWHSRSGGIAQRNSLYWPMRRRGNSRNGETIIDDSMVVSCDPCGHGRMGVSLFGLSGGQMAWPKLTVVEMVPGNKAIMSRAQPKIVTIHNALTVKSKAHPGYEMTAGW